MTKVRSLIPMHKWECRQLYPQDGRGKDLEINHERGETWERKLCGTGVY